MDEKRPKRRKDKYNPYCISKERGRYFLYFKDGQGVSHHYEIDRSLFDLFDSFELDDLSFLNEWDRHIEQSDLTENSLNQRAFQKFVSVEDSVIDAIQMETLHTVIAELPEIQRRRLRLYYHSRLTYAQIAKLEKCTKRAVKFSVDLALEKIKKFL